MSVNLILYHARLVGGSQADAVAVRCGRIMAVDRTERVLRLRGPRTRVLDLAGRTLAPGFFDSHVHFLQEGLALTYELDLSPARSLREALELLRGWAQQHPEGWVVARGWDESVWPERRYLERADLDRAVPQAPAVALRVDGHMVAANTLALARCLRPEGELVDRDRGHLWEEAAQELLACAQPELEQLVEAAAAASRKAASLGVTAVADMGGPQTLAALQAAGARGLLVTRCFLYLPPSQLPHLAELGISRGFGGELVRIQGIGEVYVDGSLGAHTAALQAPYSDGEGCGKLLLSQDELAALWTEVDRAGLQLAIHAIGDRAIEEVLAAGERALFQPQARHRVEHLELPTQGQLARLAKLGVVASMQPNFAARWSGPGRLYETRLGPERDRRSDPHAWVVAHGVPLAFGSDCMPFGPLAGLAGALHPPQPAQRLPPEEALRAYSLGGAYAVGWEHKLGSLEVGKLADLVVLSADPTQVPGEEIQVELTFLAGKEIYSR
jgi:hypothetical protein